MSSDYSYDEQGQFFPFFILTLTGLVTVPPDLHPRPPPVATKMRLRRGSRPTTRRSTRPPSSR
ncbi:secretory subunit [Fusarium falciforme]